MRINLQKTRKFPIKSEGLTNPSIFPEFLQALEKVLAPNTCQNVANVLIDFITFLTERFGQEGPSRFAKPESIKAQLQNYKRTFNKPARAWRQRQSYLDFTSLPSREQIIEVKSKIGNYVHCLLDKSLSSENLSPMKTTTSKSAFCVS